MVLNTETVADPARVAAGFNQGMEEAANTFSLMIQVLAFSFLLKVVIRFPPVYNYIDERSHREVVEIVEYSADVLAFFITVMMYWSLRGNNLIS